VSFEDKFKANLERGNAELEKRRLTLQDAQRREMERQAQKAREEQERRDREAREIEERRRREEERREREAREIEERMRKEEESRLERQKELDRQKEEERLREMERKEVSGCRFSFGMYDFVCTLHVSPKKSRSYTLQCPVHSRLHSGSSSVRGRRSGRGGGEGSSR